MSHRVTEIREKSREQETTQAQQLAQQRAQSGQPIIDLQDEDSVELLDRLTRVDVESDQFDELQARLQPFLSSTQMLASHDADEYYDDLSNELLNENLADRLVAASRRGQSLTGEFASVANDVKHESGLVESRPLGPSELEALRTTIEKVRTDRQSLGDGTFLKAITEMHVSSEVRRDDDTGTEGSGSLLGWLNPF